MTDKNVPGLDELRKAQDAAYNERARFDYEMNRMMETGSGIYPEPIDDVIIGIAEELADYYPRAALYIEAEGYKAARNIDKSIAGEKAMKIIATGGLLAEARDVLDNWLPEESMWD